MRTRPTSRRPARLSAGLGGVAGLVGALAAFVVSVSGGVVAAVGLVVLLLGLVVGARRAVSTGAAGLLVGVLVGGLESAPVEVLFVGVVASVLAWDAGGHAIDVGAQLGREADTRRVEVVHLVGSAAAATAAAVVGYGVYLTAGGGQPVAALLLLLLAGVILLATLDRA